MIILVGEWNNTHHLNGKNVYLLSCVNLMMNGCLEISISIQTFKRTFYKHAEKETVLQF